MGVVVGVAALFWTHHKLCERNHFLVQTSLHKQEIIFLTQFIVTFVIYTSGPGGWAERGTSGSRLSLSSDSGMSWTPLRNGLPDRLTSSFQAVSLEDWGESFAVYGATTTGEVWASEDGGENWGEIISGLPPVSKSMHYVLLDPSNTWLG